MAPYSKHIFNTSVYLKQINEQGFAVELSWSFRGWHLHGGSCSWCMCNFVIFWLCNCVMCLGEINNHWIGRHALGATHTSSSKVRSPKSIKKLWLRWRLVQTSNSLYSRCCSGQRRGECDKDHYSTYDGRATHIHWENISGGNKS